MIFFKFLSITTLLVYVTSGQECTVKKTSCTEIKTAEGLFRFSHEIPGGTSLTVIRHQTTIAHVQDHPPARNFTEEVKSIDNSSVVTATCEDLRIEVRHDDGEHISDSCVDFSVTGEVKPSDLEGEVKPQLGNIECSIKNVSCAEIKTAEGFNFSHGISEGSTITADRNNTNIAHAQFHPPSFNFTPEVKSMDRFSIVTATCEALTIKATHDNGHHMRESCVKFRITEESEPSDPEGKVTPYLKYIIGGAVFCTMAFFVFLHNIKWKRKQKKKNRDATCRAYMNRCKSCSFIWKSGEEQEPDGAEDGEDGDVTAPQPDASSIDPEAGGGTAHMLGLNQISSDGRIQPSTNGCISHPDDASGSNDQTVNQNVEDDPGGMSDDEGKRRKMDSGMPLVGQSPEGHENEDEPLLSKPRLPTQVSYVAGADTVVWWTCNGSDPAPTSRCSTAADKDVDSSNMKQNEIK